MAVPAGGQAGQVGQSGNLVAGLEDPGDLGGVGRGSASGAVGDAHKVRLQLGDLLGGKPDRVKVTVLLGALFFN